ncbi:hypothetical protein OPQ81_009426 [Rhizoctonia solani]|nr:hypothetical protein OPQ81_009426 [Rhizoctonia solani]
MYGRAPLPHETILDILVWSAPLDIIRCRLVCRSFRDVVDSSPELQFLLELHSFGYTVFPSLRLGTPCKDRAALFRKFQQNWTSESATPIDKYALKPVEFGTTYKFCNGVYARGSSLLGVSRTCGLDLYQLPSVIKGTQWRQWSHPDLGVEIDDFIIEPDYDLLVLLRATTFKHLSDTREPPPQTRPDVEQTFTIHLCSLETNLPHPEATCTEMKCTVPGLAGEAWSLRSQVVGNYLAVMFLHTSTNAISYLIVWDWVIGREVTRVDSGFSAGGSGACSFTFLSDHLILVPSNLIPSRFDSPSDDFDSNQGRLDIYTFEDPIGGALAKPACRLASLLLPAILSGRLDATVVRVECRCDPAPPVSTADRLRRYSRAFQLVPEKRVVCLTITLLLIFEQTRFWNRQSDLYIPVSDLLNVVLHLPDSTSSPPYISWENWAKHTSFVDTGSLYSSDGVFKQHGQRSIYAGGSVTQPATFNVNSPIAGDCFRQAYIDGDHKANTPFVVRTILVNEVINPGYKLMIDDEHVVIVSENQHQGTMIVYSFC